MSHHACSVFLYMIYRPGFLYVTVITYSFRYCQSCCSYFNALLALLLYLHILSFIVLFLSCTLIGPLLTNLYYFSVSRSESRYRELIVEHILIQLFSDEFSFFFLTCLIQIWWMILLMFLYFIYAIFFFVLGCICIYVCYPAHFDNLRYS